MANFIKGAWKAVVAAASPLVSALVLDLLEVLEPQVTAIVTAVVGALFVYLVPNQEPE